ncbi:hypothetical protein LC593_28295 [Nostoc sp. CHAB 5844]|nr:hypothetical protein [Nostoc sp. CHAB 5844]
MNRMLAKLQFNRAELFHNYENFLQELSDTDSIIIHGGNSNGYSKDSSFERKLLEYALVGFAIHNIVSLVKLFIDSSKSRSQN